jgi:MoaA/NifB/PqqE/SkfB family radical SAM enzyme
MAKIVIELTNRCNLNCHHCFSGRHGGRDDLPLAILERVWAEAKCDGFDLLSFTGGDPTVYRHFAQALRRTAEAGYRFTFNTNGWNFASTYMKVLPYRQQLEIIVFSLDGASEATHDRLRGRGSYRRVMQAVSICVMEDLPFAINMVITAHNRHELRAMAQLAPRLGSRGLRFGHLMPAPLTTAQGFDLSPWERKQVEAEIWHLRSESSIPIAIAPGYHTTNLFPCTPLHLQEVNIDCHGNLTKCCHLSGHGEGMGDGDVIGNLGEMSFREAYHRLVEENQRFHQSKVERLRNRAFQDADFFTCWYCSNHYKKVDWLQAHPDHPWLSLRWAEQADEQRATPAITTPIELVLTS